MGSLPSNTEINPREHVNAITTWNGMALRDPPLPTKDDDLEEKGKKSDYDLGAQE